jgi:hypothetical protein
MRLSGSVPVLGRRMMVGLAMAGMLLVAAPGFAQDPAAAGAQEPPDMLLFKTAAPVMMVLSVNQGQEATFESGYRDVIAGLNAASKPEFQQQAQSMQLMKVDLPPSAGQPVLYLIYLNPPMTMVSYDFTKILYYSGAFDISTPEARTKVDDIFAKFKVALAGTNVWPLAKK